MIAFIGLCHEVIGATLFPWGPAAFGGPFGWHAAGIAGITSGLLLLLGTLHVVDVPVFLLALAVAVVGATITVYTALAHGQFHLFAVVLALSGILVGQSHRRTESPDNPAP